MSDGIIIRRVTKPDLPECLSVIREAFSTVAAEFKLTRENSPKHTSFIEFSTLAERFDAGNPMFMLTADSKAAGYYSLSDRMNGAYSLNNLAVAPKYRHNGYGRMLLNHAAETVRSLGGDSIVIGIIEESTVLRRWYEDAGYIHIGTRKFAHLPFTVGEMRLDLA